MSDKLSQEERTARETARRKTREAGFNPVFEDGWLAARDYGRERERALEEALRFYADPIRLIKFVEQHNRADANDRERGAGWWAQKLSTIASDALAASQPEVLSERSDTEPGEPEKVNVPGRRVIEDDGTEGSMVVASAYTRQQAIIDALKILQNRTVGSPEACERAIDVLAAGLAAEENAQPDHGPGEPSDAVKRLKAWRDILEREAALESRDNDEQVEVEGRVLHNLKQAIDAVLVGENNG